MQRVVRFLGLAGLMAMWTLSTSLGQETLSADSTVQVWSERIAEMWETDREAARLMAEKQLGIALDQTIWPLAGELQAILGDIALDEGNLSEALAAYELALTHLQRDPARAD